MTDDELKNLLAETLRSIAELRESQRETGSLLRERQEATDRQLQATDRQLQETDRLLRERQEENARQLRETERLFRESEARSEREAAELRRQMGQLGEKFGGFTEGMAFPSMSKLLRERFGMTHVTLRSTVRKNGRSHEIDVLGYSNTDRNVAFVVEVKSRLREESIEQILRILKEFPEFYPEHKDKKLYGILAAVDIPDNLRPRVLREGIYLARIHDEIFELDVPPGFEPRSFQE